MKALMIILALLAPLMGRGQIFLDWYEEAPSATLLLDDYPNATSAYSLRKLRAAYSGNCVEVRRVSDGTLSNIGFSGNVIDTVALKAFCAGTNCFVRTWYDQSTNGRNGIQTTNARQPQIVSSGTILYAGGLPTIAYDGTDDVLEVTTSGLNTGAALYSFEVYQTNAAAALNSNTMLTWALGVANSSTMLISKASSTGFLTNETFFLDTRRTATGAGRAGSTTYARSANTLVQETVEVLSTGFGMYQNSSAVTFNAFSSTAITDNLTPNNSTYAAVLYLGAMFVPPSGGVFTAQRISEMVFYNTNQSSNRTGIETNQQNFY